MIRHNPWAQLYDLIAGPPTQCGKVLSTYSDASMEVELLGGGVLRIKGSGYLIGSNVFFKGDTAVGQAPSGEVVEIDV